MQMEHYIFQNVSHVHFWELQPIVEEFCKKKGYSYVKHPSIWSWIQVILKDDEASSNQFASLKILDFLS